MNVQDYLKLPYSIVIQERYDETGHYFFASVEELPGCMSDGATVEEAYANIYEAMSGHIESMLAHNFKVPVPVGSQESNIALVHFVSRIIAKQKYEDLLKSQSVR